MTKEAIYDRDIAPLMAKIIETCKANGIALVASFGLDVDDEDSPLLCTTIIGMTNDADRLTAALRETVLRHSVGLSPVVLQ
jgi:hypothetical protein